MADNDVEDFFREYKRFHRRRLVLKGTRLVAIIIVFLKLLG